MATSFVCQSVAARVDELLMGKFGFALPQLVEQAGLACALAASRVFPLPAQAIVLAGPGNNGADGLVAARHLTLFGYKCTVVYPRRSSSEFMEQLIQQCKSFSIEVRDSLPPLEREQKGTFFVDALFGFSFKPPVRPPFDVIISEVSASRLAVFSIDIPSGWGVDSGPPSDGSPFILPSALISLSVPKQGVSSFRGRHFLGGRFLPPSLVDELGLVLPPYPSTDLIVELPPL